MSLFMFCLLIVTRTRDSARRDARMFVQIPVYQAQPFFW